MNQRLGRYNLASELRPHPNKGINGLAPGFIAPCLPSPSKMLPASRHGFHEIKHDGYRLIARRDGNRVRLIHPSRLRLVRQVSVDRSSWTGRRFGLARMASRISTLEMLLTPSGESIAPPRTHFCDKDASEDAAWGDAGNGYSRSR
jgi:hypothetical protein